MTVRRNIILGLLVSLLLFLLFKLDFFKTYITGVEVMTDFDAYYRLISDAKKGIHPYTVPYMKTQGPPLVFLYYYPFTFLPLHAARSLFNVINLTFFAASVVFLSKTFFKHHVVFATIIQYILFLSSHPVRFSIQQGQPIMVLAFFITLSLMQQNKKITGVYLAVLSMIKTYFVLSLAVYIRKKRIVVYASCVMLLLFFLCSFLFINPQWYWFYVRQILISYSSGQAAMYNYYNQSLLSACTYLGEHGVVVYFGIVISSLLFLVFRGNLIHAFIFSIILSPVSWQHYFASLFPIYVVLFRSIKGWRMWVCYGISFLLWWREFPFLHNGQTSALFHVLSFHFLFSAIVLLSISIHILSAQNSK